MLDCGRAEQSRAILLWKKLVTPVVLLTLQVRDLQSAFSGATNDPETLWVAQQLGQDVIDSLVSKQAERAGVPANQLFPAYSFLSSFAAR